jgi:hypothetical protein
MMRKRSGHHDVGGVVVSLSIFAITMKGVAEDPCRSGRKIS